MKKKISVIIGAYNAEPFLNRCIDSVVEQKEFAISDLEIVLCNDGSDDNTLAIMQEYKIQYPDIVTIDSHENIKPAKTKNRAIKIARGDYIVFLDADDWLDANYLNRFYKEIEAAGADVVFGGYKRISQTGKTLKIDIPPLFDYAKYMFVVSTMRIHRREFIVKNDISFSENAYGEDILFTVKQIAAKAVFRPISYAGYNYLYNTTSITNTTQKGLTETNTDTVNNLLKQIIQIGEPIRSEPEFKYYLIRTVVFNLLYSGKYSSSQQFMNAYEKFFEVLLRCIPEVGSLVKVPRGETLGVRVIICLILLFRKMRLMWLFAKIYCR